MAREEDVHPYLPCGYNSWENDGDEIDGAGVNDPLYPVWFDTFMPLTVMTITDEMLDAFNDCPDYVVPATRNVYVVPGRPMTVMIMG